MKLGIIMGGGPAPGINAVIGAATIEAVNNGLDVLGFYDGFSGLAQGTFDVDKGLMPLGIAQVARIHFDGGSILRTARANLFNAEKLDESMVVEPDARKADRVAGHLRDLDVGMIVTIGGDDTALSARLIGEHTHGAVKVAHVPKTIDNDLPLPGDTPTFGFTSARSLGADLVANLMADSRTTNRWYIVQTMGRNAGFLALGIGKAAGTTVTLIPEEIPDTTTIDALATVLEGAIFKRRLMGRRDGVAVLAEGLAHKLGDIEDLSRLLGRKIPTDVAGHPRLSEIPLAALVRDEISQRFAKRGDPMTMVAHTRRLRVVLRPTGAFRPGLLPGPGPRCRAPAAGPGPEPRCHGHHRGR